MGVLCDTGCGFLPAPAWVVEIIRRIQGPMFAVQQGRRPGQPHNLFRDDGTPRPKKNVTRPLPPDPPLRFNMVPMPQTETRDRILMYTIPGIRGGKRQQDIVVVSRFGNVVLNEREVEVTKAEILEKYPNAEFKVLRDLTTLPGGGMVIDRTGDIPVLRYKAWP